MNNIDGSSLEEMRM